MNADTRAKVVLVTGASSGFGEAMARKFALAGDRVVLCGRRESRLEALRAELGASTCVLPLDVRDFAAVRESIASLREPFDKIDILINNAGLALGLAKAESADWADWEQMIATNCSGLAHLTRAVLPGMIQRDRGHIVNIGSIAGTFPYPGGNVYGATKAFVHQFTLGLLADLVTTKVRVTTIEPGLAEIEFSLVRFRGDEAAAKRVYEGTSPLRPEDIAESVYWATHLPAHVNASRIELFATCQGPGPLAIHRQP